MLNKIRIYEYAKSRNMSSKEILTILDRLNISVTSHMSVIDQETMDKIEQFFINIKKTAASVEPTKPQAAAVKTVNKPAKPNLERKTSVRAIQRPEPNRPKSPRFSQDARPVRKTTEQTVKAPERRSAAPQVAKPKGTHQAKTQNKFSGDRDTRLNISARNNNRNYSNNRRYGSSHKSNKPKQQPVLPKEIEVTGPLTVGDFARLLRRDAAAVIKSLMSQGIMSTINQELDIETMSVVAEGFEVKLNHKELIDESLFEDIHDADDEKDLVKRPPVVTIMGHVDHGKTTLLDKIRESNVTSSEAGGITQHIGAYQVDIKGEKITFLDTPGHAAFTTIRARGAKVTDITVLVVAAEDGVMPQTIEAISHAKAAEVPIIVAINKMDKPDAAPERIKQQLTEYGLVAEEWGGDTVFVPISAKKGEGIQELLEMILLLAEVQEYKANPSKRARGVVIESQLDKGKGVVATLLIQSGTLNIGDSMVAGSYFGKIRAMTNDQNRRIKSAGPSTPIEVLGLPGVPNAGDPFIVFEDEKKGRFVADKRMIKQRDEERGSGSRVTIDDLFKKIQEGEIRELSVIIKADVNGSAEAMRGSLEKLDVDGVKVKIIHSGVGAITESDIILASASNAIVIGFNVRPEPNARAMAEQEQVDVRLHRVIYNAIEEIELAMKGMLDPVFEEKVIGTAEVREIFKVSKIGTIAGCYVVEGKVARDSKIRLIRDGIVIYEGELDSLKRFKDDAKEVAKGYECGVTIVNYNDIKVKDLIEFFVVQEVAPK